NFGLLAPTRRRGRPRHLRDLGAFSQGSPESENTAGAARVRFLGNFNLPNSRTVVATDAEDVLSVLKRPIVSPNDPCQVGERRPQRCRHPVIVINLDFNARNAPRACVGDPTNRHQHLSVSLDSGLYRYRIDHRSGFYLRRLVPTANDPVSRFISLD